MANKNLIKTINIKFMQKKLISLLICFFVFCAQQIFCQPVWTINPSSSRLSPSFPHNNFFEFDLVSLAKENDEKVFIIGEDSQSYVAERTVENFFINRYETSYRFWYAVRVEAERQGYTFKNPGQEGSNGRRGKTPTEKGGLEPVTMINWYDVVVWCNALSEQEGRTPCYTYQGEVLRDSSETSKIDLCECDWTANGFRLPTESEWEYAARFSKDGFQSGSTASGRSDTLSEKDVAWFDANTDGTKTIGTAGLSLSTFKSVGKGNANGAGLFDMSGNVLEFCWDWFGDYQEQKEIFESGAKVGKERVCRGGSWSMYTSFIACGDRYSFDPNESYNYLGFRFATSKN